MKKRIISLKLKVILGISGVLLVGIAITTTLSSINFSSFIFREIIDKARSITIMGEAVREYTSDNWERNIYDQDAIRSDIKNKFLYTVPVISAIRTMEKEADKLGYEFRVPKESPRNPVNQPTDDELTVLKKLKSDDLDEYHAIKVADGVIEYYRSIRLTDECLWCHGDPRLSETLWGRSDGTDPTGSKMEGWNAGEIHGAFKLTYNIQPFLQKRLILFLQIAFIAAIVIAGSIISGRIIIARTLRPLDKIGLALQDINKGAGDLTQTIEIQSEDEVGLVAYEFNKFIESLRQMMIKVSDSARVVSSSSEQMTAASQHLADSAQNQAASIEETSSAMEEIKATIDSVSNNARNQANRAVHTHESMTYLAGSVSEISDHTTEANQMAEETQKYANEGGQILTETVNSMNEISTSSKKILDILTIITDITEQINLLSLNASIEAARAGDEGRGFAVVAEEIAKLADETAQSSKQINDVIQETDQKVGTGAMLVEKTAGSLKLIITNIEKTTALMEEIAEHAEDLTKKSDIVSTEVVEVSSMSEEISIMMEEQSSSSNEILNAINQINEITQQVSSGSEELAAASEELASQAEILSEIVGGFKV
jgi:methyl-accepting chemotaxis protein